MTNIITFPKPAMSYREAVINATIDRMIKDGLIEVLADGRLRLTKAGRAASAQTNGGKK